MNNKNNFQSYRYRYITIFDITLSTHYFFHFESSDISAAFWEQEGLEIMVSFMLTANIHH